MKGIKRRPASNPQTRLAGNPYDLSVPATANPAYWLHVHDVEPWFRSIPGKSAYDAILSIIEAPFRGECTSTAEITLLYAAAEVMGIPDPGHYPPIPAWAVDPNNPAAIRWEVVHVPGIARL